MPKRENHSRAPSMWASRSLPFQEDMAFQMRDWRAERLGWCIMGVFVVLACLGLFSNGPLSTTTAHDDALRLSVDYERFYRVGASSDMRWLVEASPGTETIIAVNREFLDAFTLDTVSPEPSRMVGTSDGMQLIFAREEGASLAVVLSVTPDEVGTVSPEVSLQGTEPIRLNIFIYP